MSIIVFNDVTYFYPDAKIPALEGINLAIAQGEFLAVMGETGSGKTTFCKLINGIIPHLFGGSLTGSITVDGICTENSSVPALAEIIGLVLDDPDAQLFTSFVRTEAAFGPENLLIPPEEIKERVAEALFSVGLAGFDNRQVTTLSGGEKQRLAIASFLTMKSKILVLDEPLCRLDTDGAKQVMSVLKSLRQHGITIIMTSHDSKIMQEFADRVCIIKNGSIIICDTPKKIFKKSALLEENGIHPPVNTDIYSVFTKKIDTDKTQNELTPAIQIKDFSFSYNKNVFSFNISNLIVEAGDFTAIIGPNGCGKTTLLKNIMGLLRPMQKKQDNGNIYIRGKNTKKMTVSDISKEAGFVMQNPDNQLFTDSVYKEVAFALKNMGLKKKEIDIRVEDALNITGLRDRDAFPYTLNRADRTKLVIACVLAMGCKIILFDEVDVGQDYRGSIKIMDIARELNSKGYTIVFVTHNMSLVCKYANRLIIMEKDGSVSEWKRKK
ncbi:MAG: energy-coupling factor ABC transporter ATP-binding protein [Treponema sp.]|jgi:energy-coupling factor transport system ATP-binding protein|nr:energy-coupling factor ABC transporter ATP-binding protein [Treponema sp.]